MKILKKIGKITLIFFCVLVMLVLLTIGSFNLLKFAIYDDYYDARTKLCKNPGLGDGFVCQGICALEKEDAFNVSHEDKIFVSGYMADGSASRIYVTDLDNNSYYVSLKNLDGSIHDEHAGGIAVHGNTVYVVDDDAIHVLPLEFLLNAKNGDTLTFVEKIPVNNQASFVYADDNYLWVGEFHNGKQYVTDHPYNTPEGMNYAIVSRYDYTDLSKPNKIYSIRNKVQGFCYVGDSKTGNGQIVLSTSYGVTDSVYYVYDDEDAIDSGLTLDGAPVYFFTECDEEVSGPAMAEGLDYFNGKVITLTESACNKYIFGKFFFANKIVALDINEF